VVSIAAAILALTACSIQDPTQNSQVMRVKNDTTRTVKVSYCVGLRCQHLFWTNTLAAGKSTTDNVVADGSLSRFLVLAGQKQQCMTVRLSRSAATAGLNVRLAALRPCPTSIR
jgi:hypothetical protein